MDEEDENQLCSEAKRLASSLIYEKQQESIKRSFIAQNWPEKRWDGRKQMLEDYKNFFSETFLRDAHDSDYTPLREMVRTGFVSMAAEQAEASLSSPPLEEEHIRKMSDEELLKSLPRLMTTMRFCNIKSLYILLYSEANTPNSRTYLVLKVLRKLESLVCDPKQNELRQEVLEALRNPPKKKAGRTRYGSRARVLPELPETCTFDEAVQLALLALDELPVRCLRAISDMLRRKKFREEQLFRRATDGRKRLILPVRKRVERLMSDPEEMKVRMDKPLRVISLYATEVQGDDGGLSKHLAPVPAKTKAIQERLLSGIKQLHKLGYDDLEAVYQTLTRSESKKEGLKHTRVYQEKVSGILHETLYRCGHKEIPSFVKRALDMIDAGKATATVFSGRSYHKTRLEEAEVEAVLSVSSSLQQMCWNWIEDSADAPVFDGVEEGAAKKADEETEDDEDYFLSYSLDQAVNENSGEEAFSVLDEENVEKIDEKNEELVEIADEGAALLYEIIGRAMEQRFSVSQGVRNYLCSGARKNSDEADEGLRASTSSRNHSNMLLDVLESIPSIPSSVVEKIAHRFEKLDSPEDD